MAKLIKCKCCGKDIANNCKTCIHCGAKTSKSNKGCMTLFLLVVVIGAISAVLSPVSDKVNESMESTKNEKSFSDRKAIEISRIFIQKMINSKTELKFVGDTECYRYAPDDFHTKIFKMAKMDLKNIYSVRGYFTEKNAFGVPIKHSYQSIVYWNFEKNEYACIQLFFDNVEVFPKYREMATN